MKISRRLKDKLSGFAIGTMFGIIVGASLFLLNVNSYLQDFLSLNQKTKITESVVKHKTDDSAIELKPNTKETNSQPTLEKTDTSFAEDIKVLKDEMLDAYMVKINTVESKSSLSQADSLLQSISEIKDDKDPEELAIELWKSPINYKGYKMNKTKLQLYGIEIKDANVIKCKDCYYLHSNNGFYKLAYTSEFKPLEKSNAPIY